MISAMPGFAMADVTVPAITLCAPSRAAISGSLSTPFCSDSTVGTSRPVASRPSMAASVSKDFNATTHRS